MLNVVTEEVDFPAAVLIRAIQPIEGVDLMSKRRNGRDTFGPGKLTQAMGITAYFQIHPTRSQAAFEQLMADWKGLRQTCLAHLIRTAKGLVEHLESGLAAFGRRIRDELQRLCHMSTERPTVGQWRAWYARFRHLISSTMGRLDKAGTFARRLDREQEALWLFLDLPGIDATNNAAERALRFGVMWRKRTRGTYSEKGNRWVERVLSFRQTCRIRGRPTFPLLVEAVRCRFKGTLPDLRWITHHEPLLACATP
jgi:transposase